MVFNYNELSNVMSFGRNELFAHDISMDPAYMVHYRAHQCLPLSDDKSINIISVHGILHISSVNCGSLLLKMMRALTTTKCNGFCLMFIFNLLAASVTIN